MATANDPARMPEGEPTPSEERDSAKSPTVPLFEVPENLGNFRIKRPLAQGGMGTIFLAEQQNPKRFVVIKTPRPDAITDTLLGRFKAEAEALAALEHPFIARIFEAGTYEGPSQAQLPYLAMELVRRGRSLTLFADMKELNHRQRLELMLDVCDAIQHAHENGIVHRDLKPSNILVDAEGRVRVLDFGIARFTTERAETHFVQTNSKEAVGTLRYMSPEQVPHSGREADARSDVYSLGVILYELISRGFPYPIPASENVFDSICNIEPAPLSKVMRGVPKDLDTIVLKSLSKEPERRYQSVAALAADIRRYLNDEPILARPPSTAYHVLKFARRHRVVTGASLAVALIVVAASAVSAGFGMSERRARSNERAANRQAQLEHARRATADGSWQTAIDIYEGLSATGELGFEAQIDLIDAMLAVQNVGEAEALLGELSSISDLDDSERARVLLRQGDLLLTRATLTSLLTSTDQVQSLQMIREASQLGLDGADGRYAAALLATTAPDAVGHLRSVLELTPRHRRARELLAVYLLFLAELDEAEKEAAVLDALFPEDWSSTFLFAAIAARRGEADLAHRHIETMRGVIGDVDVEAAKAAVDIFAAASGIVSTQSHAVRIGKLQQLFLSWIRASTAWSSQKTSPFQIVTTPCTTSFVRLAMKGNAAVREGRHEEALHDLRLAAKVIPNGETHACLAFTHIVLKDYESALVSLNDTLARVSTPDMERRVLHYRIAVGLHVWRQRTEGERSEIREQLIADIMRLRGLGELRVDEAATCAKVAWQIDRQDLCRLMATEWTQVAPDSGAAWLHHAYADLESGAFVEAIESCEHAERCELSEHDAGQVAIVRRRALAGLATLNTKP